MLKESYKKDFGISSEIFDKCQKAERSLTEHFAKIDNVSEFNQLKVLKAFHKNKLSDTHFGYVTGYGYNDIGRDVLERIYSDIFKGEDALVRPQLISGTHALSTALFANLKAADELLSPVGTPYDTLQSVIGIKKTQGSLIETGVKYREVALNEDGTFNYETIKKNINEKTKMVTIQRSKGYSLRKSLLCGEIGELITFIKNINENIICMVDNCYGEFVENIEPLEVGADICVGSLIKNPGGGLAPVGGYIVGKKNIVQNCAYRLTSPGLGKEVGPSLGITHSMLQGLYLAPYVVGSTLKNAILFSKLFSTEGYFVTPKPTDTRSDIVQAINLQNEEEIIKFCKGIQRSSPVDSFVNPEPWDMPGYDNKIIMAAGTFIQGSSLELSADAPIKPPYTVFVQGGLTYAQGKLGAMMALNALKGES